MLRTIGLMSGTSLDGVDAAWLETDGERIGAFGPTLTLPYDERLRADLRRILDQAPNLDPDDRRLKSAVARLTEYHVRAVAALGRPADLIGFHGQTILHQPDRQRTWQVGDAAELARRTGIPVAYDFRSADVAAGGQGAPLAPVYHAALARDVAKPLAVLNIGGVANVTWIGADGELVAFDTGPGNGPLDDWIARRAGAAFDRDGAIARSGRVDAGGAEPVAGRPVLLAPAAEIARPAGLRRIARREPARGPVASRWRGDPGCFHRRRRRRRPTAGDAAALGGHRRRAAQPGDHGGAARQAGRAGRTGRGARLGRRCDRGTVLRLPRRAHPRRAADQLPRHDRRSTADDRRQDRPRPPRRDAGSRTPAEALAGHCPRGVGHRLWLALSVRIPHPAERNRPRRRHSWPASDSGPAEATRSPTSCSTCRSASFFVCAFAAARDTAARLSSPSRSAA